MCRRALAWGAELHSSAQTYFPDYLDRSLRLPAYWATCEQEIAGDGEAACQVWEATLQTPVGM